MATMFYRKCTVVDTKGHDKAAQDTTKVGFSLQADRNVSQPKYGGCGAIYVQLWQWHLKWDWKADSVWFHHVTELLLSSYFCVASDQVASVPVQTKVSATWLQFKQCFHWWVLTYLQWHDVWFHTVESANKVWFCTKDMCTLKRHANALCTTLSKPIQVLPSCASTFI